MCRRRLSGVGLERRTTVAGDVRYEVRLRGPDRRERSRTFRTRKAAEIYERELLAQRDRGVGSIREPVGSLSPTG